MERREMLGEGSSGREEGREAGWRGGGQGPKYPKGEGVTEADYLWGEREGTARPCTVSESGLT